MSDLPNVAPGQPESFPTLSGLMFVAAQVSNFRGLKFVDMTFDRVTVIHGASNADKNSFLEALCATIVAQRLRGAGAVAAVQYARRGGDGAG